MTSELRTSILLLVGAPVVWIGYFWLVYLVAEVDCRFGADQSASVVVTLTATVVTMLVTGWLTWRAFTLWRHGGHDRTIAVAGMLIGAIMVVATVFVGVSLVVPPC